MTNYEWDFGNNYSSNLEHPWHTFSNTNLSDSVFTISLIVSTMATLDLVLELCVFATSGYYDVGYA